MMGEAVNMAVVMDSTGKRITGDVTIHLRPGVGVQGPTGEHLEGGPHVVSVAFAAPLITAGRATIVQSPVEQPVSGAPDGVQQRDPIITSRDGNRGRR